MKRRAFVGSLTAWPVLAASPEKSEAKSIREIAEAFLREHGVGGMSIAYGRDGTVDFEQGYGFADVDGKEPVTPQHRFRIASISKPFTATAVMMQVEKGRLKLSDKIWGAKGLLGGDYDGDLAAITIDHLLTHTSGGWANDKNDPMFKHIAKKHDELIAWTLANQKLTHPPGTHFAYSNFGYCVLGRVLEKLSGKSYAEHLEEAVFAPCGITSMRIAGNTLADRQPPEVMYLTEKSGAAYTMNVSRMDSHGGWIATAGDLVRFASQLPKLLNAESIETMTTSGINKGYARGWNVNPVPNWWHTGSLPGTSTIMVRTAKGYCWAGLLNGGKDGLGLALDKLMWRMAREIGTLGL
jgi:CubicO group peptidase (beta-lactamase class C family)